MNDTLNCVVRMLETGAAEMVLQVVEAGGAEKLAGEILATDPAARAEFPNAAVLASYLRSLAAPQERDARRALAEPGKAPRLPFAPTAAAALHNTIARSGPPVMTPASLPMPVTTAAAPVPRPQPVATTGPVRLRCGPVPTPFDRALVAQLPHLYCL